MNSQHIVHGGFPTDAVKTLLPILIALVLIGITAQDLAKFVWKTPENSYAPWLLLTSLVLLVYHALKFNWREQNPSARSRYLALFFLTLGAPGFALGHALQLDIVTATSNLLLIAGVVTWAGGVQALQKLRFPLVFSLLALPYPAYWVTSLTGPIKVLISQVTEFFFYHLGFPIARDGVILALGPYRLLVADACSGLNSLVFLVALGLLYMHFTGHRTRGHRLMLALLLPMLAIMANTVRVVSLAFITYYFGDSAGQSFLHNVAGLVLFASGFMGLLLADSLIRKIQGSAPDRSISPAFTGRKDWPRTSVLGSAMISSLLIGTVITSLLMKPTQYLAQTNPVPPLAQLIPEQMGNWVANNRSQLLLVVPSDESLLKEVYSQTLSRVYTNTQGHQIMLAVAYGGYQFGNELQAHRPESCYKAAGFELIQSNDVPLSVSGASLNVRQLVTLRRDRMEPVSYWMTVGDKPTLPGFGRKWVQVQQGWKGQIPDGFLVRVSSLDNDSERAFQIQADFIRAMQAQGLSRLGLPKSKVLL